MIDTDQYVQQQRRETIKEKREEYYRVKVAFEQLAPDADDREQYHTVYQNRVSSWCWDFHAAIKSAADNGTEPYRKVWEERSYGNYTGLNEVFESVFMGKVGDDLLASELLDRIAGDLEQISVQGLDLPEQPPVVDEPWSPDELMSESEIEAVIEEAKDERVVGGDLE